MQTIREVLGSLFAYPNPKGPMYEKASHFAIYLGNLELLVVSLIWPKLYFYRVLAKRYFWFWEKVLRCKIGVIEINTTYLKRNGNLLKLRAS